MPHQCPLCESTRIVTKDAGKRTGAIIGGTGGALSGAAGAVSGAEIGSTVGVVAGPLGIALGGLAGAILGGLIGGTTGCIAGSKLGEVVDQKVLDNFQCQSCGHSFSKHLD